MHHFLLQIQSLFKIKYVTIWVHETHSHFATLHTSDFRCRFAERSPHEIKTIIRHFSPSLRITYFCTLFTAASPSALGTRVTAVGGIPRKSSRVVRAGAPGSGGRDGGRVSPRGKLRPLRTHDDFAQFLLTSICCPFRKVTRLNDDFNLYLSKALSAKGCSYYY